MRWMMIGETARSAPAAMTHGFRKNDIIAASLENHLAPGLPGVLVPDPGQARG
jgi:hypothetical protein